MRHKQWIGLIPTQEDGVRMEWDENEADGFNTGDAWKRVSQEGERVSKVESHSLRFLEGREKEEEGKAFTQVHDMMKWRYLALFS